MISRIDLNADVGEGAGQDAAIMPFITSANIACGAHAGDAHTMRETLQLAALHHVAVGAHPGYPDPEHFGRRRLGMTPGEIHETVSAQIGLLRAAADELGLRLAHVKPHGALYNDAAVDAHIARAVARAVHDADAHLLLFGPARSALLAEAERVGIATVAEAFADRGYDAHGSLVPRERPGAIVSDPDEAAARAVRLVTEGLIRTSEGVDIAVVAGTLCVHGDGACAAGIARSVREALEATGVRVAAPASR